MSQKVRHAEALYKQFLRHYPELLTLKGKKIGSYYASDEEISPFWLDQALKTLHEIYYPILHPLKKRQLFFAKESRSTRYNKYQLKEPLFIADQVLAPWELDLIIVPMVGFDVVKNRIGMGGGFYDNSLKFCKAFAATEFVGIAFDEQQFEHSQHNLVAMNDWDIKMDTIITPSRIIC